MASASDVKGLLSQLQLVADPREQRGRRHSLIDVLFIALVAMVSGMDHAEAMEDFGEANESWFRQFLELPHGIPSQDTYLRIFAMLNPDVVQTVFRNWVDGLRTVWEGGHVAVDGKTLRRSFNKASGSKAIHMVSAWLTDEKLVLGQVKVAEKKNEIVAIPELLRLLDIHGVTVTIDAMGCQRGIAEQIVEQGGHYVLSVKENHPTLHEHVEGFFADAERAQRPVDDPAPSVETHKEIDAGHGRVETRTTSFSRDLSWVDQRADWVGLDGIAMIVRERYDKLTGTTSTEKAFFIVASPDANAESVARVVRGHWGIENGLHWVLDMTFDEDHCRVRTGHAAQNLAILRHLVMNLLQAAPGKKLSIARIRRRCGLNNSHLLPLLAGREVAA